MKKAVDARHKKAHRLDLQTYITEILKVAKGTPVSLEVTETTADGMIRQGLALYKLFNPIARNIVIKIPINPAFKDTDTTHFDGLRAIKALADKKIPVNVTLVFTPEQALLAAKAGATYVSPFAGRMDDYIRKRNRITFEKTDYFPWQGMWKGKKPYDDNGVVSGVDLVWKCSQILKHYGFKTKVLAASLRNIRQVREAALHHADAATLPFSVIQNMLKHTKTYEGMAKFTKDIVPAYVRMTEGGTHDPSSKPAAKESRVVKGKKAVVKLARDLKTKRSVKKRKPKGKGWFEIKDVEK
jgi:transaldolase